MKKPMLYVDFNELLAPDLVLLSAADTKIDVQGREVSLRDGLEVIVYMDDTNASGDVDNLLATGVVERNRSSGWGAHVKWCCRIDENGIRHQSELSGSVG
jgi:hypothetical protein